MDYPLNNQPATDRYDRMQYKYCGKSGLQLPLISLGLWHNFGSVDNFSVATDMIKSVSYTHLTLPTKLEV